LIEYIVHVNCKFTMLIFKLITMLSRISRTSKPISTMYIDKLKSITIRLNDVVNYTLKIMHLESYNVKDNLMN